MTERVLDASALACALVGATPQAAELRGKLRRTVCHAPHLVDAEIGNVLRKRTRCGEIDPAEAQAVLGAVEGVVDYRYPHVGALSEHAWSLRDTVSFYDALYVALAVRLAVPLTTGDRRLGRAPGLPCEVDLV